MRESLKFEISAIIYRIVFALDSVSAKTQEIFQDQIIFPDVADETRCSRLIACYQPLVNSSYPFFFNAELLVLLFLRERNAGDSRLVSDSLNKRVFPIYYGGARIFSFRLSSGSEHWMHETRNDKRINLKKSIRKIRENIE